MAKFVLETSTPGSGNKNKPQPRQIMNLSQLLGLLDTKHIPENIKKEVAHELSTFPEGSLDYAWRCVDQIIATTIERNNAKNHSAPKPEPVQNEETSFTDRLKKLSEEFEV